MAGMTSNAETTTREVSTRATATWSRLFLVSTCAIILASCGASRTGMSTGPDQDSTNQSAAPVVHGPALNKIIIETRTDQAQAISEVAAGKADLVLNALPPAAFRDLGAAELDKLQLHAVPADSWSILINPIPNAAPYTWTTTSGQTSFNPLAIQEVRYALNWLFNRQQLVDEILGGHGVAGFTPLPPCLAATAGYDAVPAGLGMSATGDMNRAIGEITDAMDAAANLTENSGRLLRAADGFWQYDGRPVTIKFLIRSDEPNGRLPVGRYLATQLEKVGLRVQRLERNRSALATAYYSDPADLAYHIYTEAWASRTSIAGTSTAGWASTIGQQYVPEYGTLPGGADPAWWQYRHPGLDELAIKATNEQSREEDRLTASLKALELGLKEAVRMYLAFQHETYISNKARFESSLAPDPATGLTGKTLRTARLNSGSMDAGDAGRILRVLHVQAQGRSVPDSLDPVSTDRFASGYSRAIAELVSDDMLGPASMLTPDTRTGSNTVPSSPVGASGKPYFWHNGVQLGIDDLTYAHLTGISEGTSQDTRIFLPWDLYEVIYQLSEEDKARGQQPGVPSGFDLLSSELVARAKAKYQYLLEQQWVPSALEGLVAPEQATTRYQASLDFMEMYGHALFSNGPFVLSSLDRVTGTAVLAAFQEYPYGNEYPIQTKQD